MDIVAIPAYFCFPCFSFLKAFLSLQKGMPINLTICYIYPLKMKFVPISLHLYTPYFCIVS